MRFFERLHKRIYSSDIRIPVGTAIAFEAVHVLVLMPYHHGMTMADSIEVMQRYCLTKEDKCKKSEPGTKSMYRTAQDVAVCMDFGFLEISVK